MGNGSLFTEKKSSVKFDWQDLRIKLQVPISLVPKNVHILNITCNV